MTRTTVTIVAALALAACAAPEKKPEQPSGDAIACQLEGRRIVIRFLPDELRMLTPDGEPVTLQKVPSSSGVRYTNGLIEVRGGGGPRTDPGGLVFIRDGTAWTLTNCAPLLAPAPAK